MFFFVSHVVENFSKIENIMSQVHGSLNSQDCE